MHCECCATTAHINTYRTGGKYHARLCRTCADAGHALDGCLLCGGCVWHCARIAHMNAQHRSMLEFVIRAPQAEFEVKPEAMQTYLGTLHFDKTGGLPGDG